MERRKDLDFAKGVGIILMVLGHCYSAGNGENILCWLYSFHMPLFFIVPGIVYGNYHRRTERGFGSVVIKKFKRLLIPYFFFATITASFFCVLGRKSLAVFGAYMYRIVTLQGINAMWFIPCFLVVELIFAASRRTKHHVINNVLLALAGLTTVWLPVVKEIVPGLQSVIIGSAFMALGFLCSRRYIASISLPVWIGCTLIHLMVAMWNGRVDLAYGVYGNPILYFVNGLLGTFVIIRAYDYLSNSRLSRYIVWLGEHSIVVLCTSSMVIEILRLADYKIAGASLPSLGDAEGIILCIFTMLIETIIILFSNKYLGYIVGKPRMLVEREQK